MSRLVMICAQCGEKRPVKQFRIKTQKQNICEVCFVSPNNDKEITEMCVNDLDKQPHNTGIMDAEIVECNSGELQLIDVNSISELPNEYPDEFIDFCEKNELNPPNISTGSGKALSVMLKYKYHYWNRDTCDKFVNKFNIPTKDSIQLFNKQNQWGIQTNSGTKRGQLYIVYPYCLSNKHKMRKNFKYDGTEKEKNVEIDKIKSTIQSDYINVPNSSWQLGHKNPSSTDNSPENLVLQPPIQGKYRDNYIFIDTLTKFPVPNKLEMMLNKNEIKLEREQIISYKALFDKLFASL